MNSPSVLRRRRLQFSLRTILILVTVAACGFGWLGYKIRQAHRQKETVAALRNSGWYVAYAHERDKRGAALPSPIPPGPEWLRNMFGIDFVADVCHVVTSEATCTDNELILLQEFTKLTFFGFSRSENITDAGLRHLRGLRELKFLVLGTDMTDDQLGYLRELTQLESLSIAGPEITDVGLKQLISLTQLKRLDLLDTQVTDKGCRALNRALPDLKINRKNGEDM